jgi:(p)ppGpp synthase/HD superfamily hydrolase
MKTQQMLLSTAIYIAAKAHEHQLDKGGSAYILHPLRIMTRLAAESVEVQQVAVLHDVLEDSDMITGETLSTLGFSPEVIKSLELLTHAREVSYEDYISKLSSDLMASIVKMEDLKDNSDITRLKGITRKDLQRVEKYHRAYTLLKSKWG